MVFTKVFIAGSAFFAAALAQGVAFTEWPTSVTAGQPTTLKWTGDAGAPVTLTLRKGASTALNDVEVISPDATNGEYTWTPSTDLENASDYAFQISQGDQINYSGLVSLGGGSDKPPASASAASASGPQSDTMATMASGTTIASAAQSLTSGVDREMTTAAPSTDSAPDSAPASASASASDAATATTTSDASGTSTGPESSAQATETSSPSVVARPSLMNTPFNAANDGASATDTGSASVHTGAAGRVTVPLALGIASSALLWFLP